MSNLTLFADIGRALIQSGSSEAYVVAAEKFTDAGPREVSEVLRAYESSMNKTALQSVHAEYQVTLGSSEPLLKDGVICHVVVDGVMVSILAAAIGDGKMRLLFSVVDILKIHSKIEKLEADALKTRAKVDSLENRLEVVLGSVHLARSS